jgi:ABC-type branched-subunit amino acid transport system substrate-binding protein
MTTSSLTKREFLGSLGAGAMALASGAVLIKGLQTGAMAADNPIKLGMVLDMTGAIAVVGQASLNLTQIVVDDINKAGGILGRRVDIVVVDAASDPQTAAAKSHQLVSEFKADVAIGGNFSSTRDAIKGILTERGGLIYIYPELYEGGECKSKYVFCTGPVPAQQLIPFIPWLMANGYGNSFYLMSSDYIWPKSMDKQAKVVIEQNGGKIVGTSFIPVASSNVQATVNDVLKSGASCALSTVVPPALLPLLSQLSENGYTGKKGRIASMNADENLLPAVEGKALEGLASCQDYFQTIDDPFSKTLLERYKQRYPEWAKAQLAAASGTTGIYRGIKLWEQAANAAKTTARDAVQKELDKAKLSEGLGGPCEMVPGARHLKMPMYIGVVKNGAFEVVKTLDAVAPLECGVG